MRFEWINIEQVDDSIINAFESGDSTFDEFLKENAKKWQASSESATYVFADEEEVKNRSVTRIYGYVSINTMGLLYSSEEKKYLSCAEIRMFAIAKQLRKRHDITVDWSTQLFKLVLQNLYEMSTKVIGFKAIFLNANSNGYKLYKENGFEDITEYVTPETEEKIGIEGCKPLLLVINDDMLYDIFL